MKGTKPRLLSDFQLQNVMELAKTHTNIEIGEIYDITPDTIRNILKREGIRAACFCKQCGCNRPPEEFPGKSNHTMCFRHEHRDRRTPEQRKRDYAAERERAEREELIHMQNAIRCWVATEEGAPNGPFASPAH